MTGQLPRKKATPRPVSLVDEVEASTAAASWLAATDRAAIRLAKTYAARLDQGAEEFASGVIDSTEYNKVLYLGPHLLNTLKALGCTPAERKDLGGDGNQAGGKLAQLRAVKGGRSA